MIPKVIHFCWLSNDPYPNSIVTCIESWKKHLPDYKIKRWSMTSFDINSVRLVKEAVSAKKWALAADYIRLYALYNEGGIYLDSDVMVHKDIEDLLTANFVSAVEFHPSDFSKYKKCIDSNFRRISTVDTVYGVGIQAAFLASIPNHPFIWDCLNSYKDISLDEVLSMNLTAPKMLAKSAEKYGFIYKNMPQNLSESMKLYTNNEIGQNATEVSNRYLTHMCAGSWVDKSIRNRITKLLSKLFVR